MKPGSSFTLTFDAAAAAVFGPGASKSTALATPSML
jgi:hypothetical protein